MRKTFFILFFLLSLSAFSQPWVVNMPKYDKQKLHFGFSLGLNSADFRVLLNPYLKLLDSIYVVESSSQSGLNLGIVTNLRLRNNFDLRFIPTLSFASRNLDYTFNNTSIAEATIISKKIESTFIEFPINLKFKSNRVRNYRIYVMGGAKYAIDMVSQEKVKEEDKQLVKLQKFDFGYEYGLGIDIYFELFKFSPELKWYHGLKNLLVKEETIFSSSIKELYSNVFVVSFTFE